jgi:hypothetical protein
VHNECPDCGVPTCRKDAKIRTKILILADFLSHATPHVLDVVLLYNTLRSKNFSQKNSKNKTFCKFNRHQLLEKEFSHDEHRFSDIEAVFFVRSHTW